MGAGLLYAAAFTVPAVLSASFGIYGFGCGVVLDTIAGACVRMEDKDGTKSDLALDGLGLGVLSGALSGMGTMGMVATAATGTVVGSLVACEMVRQRAHR